MSGSFDEVVTLFDRALDTAPEDPLAWLEDQSMAEDLRERVRGLLRSHLAGTGATFLPPPPAELAGHLPTDPSPAADDADAAPPEPLVEGRYRIEGPLGAGATGRVYRAHDEVADAPVALKLFPTSDAAAALRHEAALLRALRLPGVVLHLDEGRTADGRPYLVTELVEGAPFPGRPIGTWEELARPAVALLETIDRLHKAGFVHRDLKPANVLVPASGLPVVLDLGIAQAQDVQATRDAYAGAGTVRYMAPEQLREGRWSVQSDLHALGAMLYESLAGTSARSQATAEWDRLGVAAEARVPLHDRAPHVPPAVCAVVDRMLAPRPEDRPASARAVIAALPTVARSSAAALPTEDAADAANLRVLFHGPERILRLTSDAAEELWRRTQGRATHIGAELDAWERAGLGHWDAGRFRILRPALERLRQGLRVAGPPAAPARRRADEASRLRRMAAGAFGREGDTATALWDRLQQDGYLRASEEVALAALRALPADADVGLHLSVLERLLSSAFAQGLPSSFDEAVYRLSRAPDHPDVHMLERLAQGGLKVLRHEPARALELLPDPARLQRPIARRMAVSAHLYAIRQLPASEQVAPLEAMAALAEETDDPHMRFAVRSGLAWAAYLDDRYDEAARLHLEARDLQDSAHGRAMSGANAASALLEAGRFDEAVEIAQACLEMAIERRDASGEARTERVLRAAAYRRGSRWEPDEAFVEAVAGINAYMGALVGLNEAAFAWRADRSEVADRLASQAASRWRAAQAIEGALLAEALAIAAGNTELDAPTVLAGCSEVVDRIGVQVAGLVARARPDLRAACRRAFEAQRPGVRDDPDLRLEVLSLNEAAALVGAGEG